MGTTLGTVSDAHLLGAELRYVSSDGSEVVTTLAEADAAGIMAGQPVRLLPSRAGQRNYSGWLWTLTTGSLVWYESLLERDRLWLADFDLDVVGIASQPFWCHGREGASVRRHAPDFMLLRGDGSHVVVDVKPAVFLDEPKVADVFEWTGRLCGARGWRYEVWSGAPRALLTNVQFVAAGRHTRLIAPDVIEAAKALHVDGLSIQETESLFGGFDRASVRSATLSMLWNQRWQADLSVPLSPKSLLHTSAEERVA